MNNPMLINLTELVILMVVLYVIGSQDPFDITGKAQRLWHKLLHGGKR